MTTTNEAALRAARWMCVCAALVIASGCEACFTFVPVESARSEIVRDEQGALQQLVLVVDVAEIDALNASLDGLEIAHSYVALTDVDDAFPITIDVGINKIGHPPFGVWDVPHFDIHFYAQTQEQVEAVTCGGQPQVASARIPPRFVMGECVDKMGLHAHEPARPDTADPAPLTEKRADVIIGFDQGQNSFIEPMLLADAVFAGEPLDATVGRPASIGRSTLWPARFEGRRDDDAGTYRFALVEWTAIEE